MLKGTSCTLASRRVAVTMISSSTVPSAATGWANAAPTGAERPSAAATAAAIRGEYRLPAMRTPSPMTRPANIGQSPGQLRKASRVYSGTGRHFQFDAVRASDMGHALLRYRHRADHPSRAWQERRRPLLLRAFPPPRHTVHEHRRPQTAGPVAGPDLQFALAAAAALSRPHRRAGRLCLPVPQGTVAPDPLGADADRAVDHADGAGPDRRGDDLEPAGDGDRRRLRDLRVAPATWKAIPTSPSG